jgi:hypothetical protein
VRGDRSDGLLEMRNADCGMRTAADEILNAASRKLKPEYNRLSRVPRCVVLLSVLLNKRSKMDRGDV